MNSIPLWAVLLIGVEALAGIGIIIVLAQRWLARRRFEQHMKGL